MGEILYNIERREETGSVLKTPKNLLPTRQDWKDSGWPITRGSLLGFGIGILPGGMPAVASLLSYAVERRMAKHPDRFGLFVQLLKAPYRILSPLTIMFVLLGAYALNNSNQRRKDKDEGIQAGLSRKAHGTGGFLRP